MSCLPGCKRVRNHRGNCSKEPLKVRYRMLVVGHMAWLDDQFLGQGLRTYIAVAKPEKSLVK
jgi:hypothetical protein